MNIQTLLMTTLALVGCDTEKGMVGEPTGGGCDGEYPFDDNREINANDLRQAIEFDAGGEFDNLTCEMLCDIYSGPIVTIDSCTYALDFETLPDDFDSWSNTETVGTIQCAGTAEEMCLGRRPIGYIEPNGNGSDLGAHFAQVAQLEAASVLAFVELAQQLKGFKAPNRLVRRCLMAADDEVRHARAFMNLAKGFGSTIQPIDCEAVPSDMLSVALHNAVEGCVFETWAALTAHHQAARCEIPALKKLYAMVAADETRHGQLSWDMHAWFMTQLSEGEQAQVRAAQRDAFVRLISMTKTEKGHPALGGLQRDDALTMAKAFVEKLTA